MKTSYRTLIVASVALGAAALAAPAQAHDRHHHRDHHWDRHHGRVIVYGRPHYYDYGYYPRAYSYYEPYVLPYPGPSVTFAFGGHRFRHHPHWR